jgi:hypothetical protein
MNLELAGSLPGAVFRARLFCYRDPRNRVGRLARVLSAS